MSALFLLFLLEFPGPSPDPSCPGSQQMDDSLLPPSAGEGEDQPGGGLSLLAARPHRLSATRHHGGNLAVRLGPRAGSVLVILSNSFPKILLSIKTLFQFQISFLKGRAV